MLPQKLKNGDQFKPVTVRTINAIIQYLTKHRIFSGAGICLHQYANGTILSAVGSSGGGGVAAETYNGYLRAVYYADQKQIGLVCGFDPENEIAGYCWVNGQKRDIKKSVKIQAKEGFLCICGKVDSEDITLEITKDIQSASKEGDKCFYPVALVKKIPDTENYSLFQLSRWEFPQLWIFGECEEES